MTMQEMAQIIDILAIEYPQIAQKTDEEKLAMANLWAGMFADDQWQMVAMAAKAFMTTDEKGFPPHIGQIKAIINKIMTPPELKMTEQEAWALVDKATRNAAYDSEKEFSKLPPLAQKLVGSPNSLRAWALMDADTVSSVVASNFQRSYRAEVAKQKELLSLPSDVREGMQMIAAQNRALLEEGNRG